MKAIFLPLAGLALLTAMSSEAPAASPTYCAIYAKAFSQQQAMQGGEDGDMSELRAYHKCLNLDDEPAMPETAFSDPQEGGIGGPFVEVGQEEAGAPEQVADATPRPAASGRRGSGLVAWSAEWREWCRSHYPKSFDPETGTVMPLDTGKRQFCN